MSSDLTLSFDSSQARRFELSYPGLQADRSAFRFVYANATVDLRSAIGLPGGNALLKLTVGEITNQAIFEALPEIDAEGNLEFRVSGKPGFSGASVVNVLALSNQGH